MDKKIAQKGFNAKGCKRGKHGGTRREHRATKRGARAKAIRIQMEA